MKGLNIERASPSIPSRPPRPPYSSAMSAERSRTGQPCCRCHTRFGHPEERGVEPGDPRPRSQQRGARVTVEHQRDQDAEQQERDGVLVVEPDPGDDPGRQPQAGAVVDEGLGHEDQDGRPRQRVEGGRRQPVTERHHHGARGDADRGQHLRRAGTPQQPAELDGEQHRSDHREEAPEPQHHQGVRRDLGGDPGEQRRQRGLVGVAPVQPLAGRDEVELVAVRSVERRHRQQDGRLGGDDEGDRPPGVRRSLHGQPRSLACSRSRVPSSIPSPSRR